ncbi:MAG: hypothetical protein IT428_29095 [Planctomycetaceae bacterium]|nr:hypothetical protein [Planctomycetaceae bacterium]
MICTRRLAAALTCALALGGFSYPLVATPLMAQEEKKEEAKKEEPKKEEAKKEEAKKDEPKKEESKKEEAKPAEEPKFKVVIKNLDNPSGIAIHPATGHIFTASRHGIHRWVPGEKVAKLEVKDFPTDIYGKGPKYNIGPLGVAFLDNDHLIVGDGSRPDADELVRIYKIPAEKPAKPLGEGEAAFTLGPQKAQEGVSEKGEGNFYGIAVGGGSIFVTSNGDDTKGWIYKVEVKEGKPGEFKPFIATKEKVMVDAPVPVTFTADGKELVVGQMGEVSVANDALLCFYDPATGDLKKSLKMNLSDPCGLAYSPKTGKLYVTDFSWTDASKGGLFRLDIEGEEVKATKITALDKPTALAFDKDGKLYVATFGTAKEGDTKPTGELVVFEAGL